MARANMLICPNCDYKRHLTEAESLIDYALVVACLKCGAAMQCVSKSSAQNPGRQESVRESLGVEEMNAWVVS